nr:hypothetical protein BaRGS_019983 [Batillaria attramentaria]
MNRLGKQAQRKKGAAAVDIHVQDVNDNPPIFTQHHYAVAVTENVPVDIHVQDVNDNPPVFVGNYGTIKPGGTSPCRMMDLDKRRTVNDLVLSKDKM